MDSKIVSYHRDDQDHWVAALECGHNQHVRHEPPWMERPWVMTDEGRKSMIGTQLNCVKCDQMAPRDDVAYVVLLDNIPGVPTTIDVVEEHVAYLRDLDNRGILVNCGPFTDHAGGMVVLRARNDAEALAIAETDPFVRKKVRKHQVRRWRLANKGNRFLAPV